MNTVRYADFESILVPNNTCRKKMINKQVPCGYSINVADNHNNTWKQTYYRGDNAVSTFCKEIGAIAYKKISFCKRQMIELTLEEQKKYEDTKYCYICKKVFGEKKKHRKVRDDDHYTGKYCEAHIQYVICVILHKKIYLCCFITVLTMILN